MKEKADKINIKNKNEIKEKELIKKTKENSENNTQINNKENDNFWPISQNIKNLNLKSNLTSNKSEKKLIKFNINNNLNLIKKSKSYKHYYK